MTMHFPEQKLQNMFLSYTVAVIGISSRHNPSVSCEQRPLHDC
uniref:Uncharacterized protein n=1 Tax=Anguilla anguilla TaxID=7936 RepID=A0A0E9RRS7_ANGAN